FDLRLERGVEPFAGSVEVGDELLGAETSSDSAGVPAPFGGGALVAAGDVPLVWRIPSSAMPAKGFAATHTSITARISSVALAVLTSLARGGRTPVWSEAYSTSSS